MKKITLLSPVGLSGEIAPAGAEVEVDKQLAANLIYREKAVEGWESDRAAAELEAAEAEAVKAAGKAAK